MYRYDSQMGYQVPATRKIKHLYILHIKLVKYFTFILFTIVFGEISTNSCWQINFIGTNEILINKKLLL